MTKRELVMAVLEGKPQERIPAAFFTHFDKACHAGQAAVDKHLEYFAATDMDLVKIQYERTFPAVPGIETPADWAGLPALTEDFFAPQLAAVEGLVRAAKADAVIVHTLYSPFMCAGHMVGGRDKVIAHILQDPDAVNVGMARVAANLMVFVEACIRIGVDGFYHSTQGGEVAALRRSGAFEKCVRPWDLQVMTEINRRCPFNILHVCDYHGLYEDVEPTLNYPGHVVNSPVHIGGGERSGAILAAAFGRPFMGGMDRMGALAKGTPDEVRADARRVLAAAPTPFILAADCTVPAGTPWENLRAAVDEAHAWRP